MTAGVVDVTAAGPPAREPVGAIERSPNASSEWRSERSIGHLQGSESGTLSTPFPIRPTQAFAVRFPKVPARPYGQLAPQDCVEAPAPNTASHSERSAAPIVPLPSKSERS